MAMRPAVLAVMLAMVLAACAKPVPPPEPLKAEEPPPPPPTPPSPVVEAQPVPPPPPPAPMPKFAGHVASFKAMPEAERGWAALTKRFPMLQSQTPRYVEVDLGGGRGKTIRVLLGGFAERDGARAYCAERRREGLFCAPHPLP